MPTGTDVDRMRRRMVGAAAAAALCPGTVFAAVPAAREAAWYAAWDDNDGRHHVGEAAVVAGSLVARRSFETPGRAHGLALAPDGALVAVARRPGDWIARWVPGREPTWIWPDADRSFNGHALFARDGRTLCTTETDGESGEGMIVVRDPASFAERAAWRTGGRDPHDLEWLDDGRLLVANGGVELRPETGRAKRAGAPIVSSLVAFDPRDGRIDAIWRVDDPWLSLRHLDRGADGRIGVAMQSEHPAGDDRSRAPVLAILDPAGSTLRVFEGPRVGGYGGDIVAVADGWLVGCPRANAVERFATDGRFLGSVALAEACAVGVERESGRAWGFGHRAAVALDDSAPARWTSPLRFDNHALAQPAGSGSKASSKPGSQRA